jgi:hypothetical protein
MDRDEHPGTTRAAISARERSFSGAPLSSMRNDPVKPAARSTATTSRARARLKSNSGTPRADKGAGPCLVMPDIDRHRKPGWFARACRDTRCRLAGDPAETADDRNKAVFFAL